LGTGVAELGAKVGLTRPALYYYIESKENLLVEIQNRALVPLLAVAKEISDEDELDPVLRLRLLSAALLEIIFTRLDSIYVYEHEFRHLHGVALEKLIQQRADFENIVKSLFEQAMDRGVFHKRDARLAMLQFLNLHNHTYHWVNPDGEWQAEFLSREFCRTILLGFLVDPGHLDVVEAKVAEYPTARERYRRHGPG
jgi:AcrR family transcriptional regulator